MQLVDPESTMLHLEHEEYQAERLSCDCLGSALLLREVPIGRTRQRPEIFKRGAISGQSLLTFRISYHACVNATPQPVRVQRQTSNPPTCPPHWQHPNTVLLWSPIPSKALLQSTLRCLLVDLYPWAEVEL